MINLYYNLVFLLFSFLLINLFNFFFYNLKYYSIIKFLDYNLKLIKNL